MRKTFLAIFMFLAALSGFSQTEGFKARISIFSDHILSLSRQQGLTFQQAAKKLRDMGYDGVDVKSSLKPEMMDTLKMLGFEFPVAIAHIDITRDSHLKELGQLIDFSLQHGIGKVFLVPGTYENEPSEADLDTLAMRWNGFVRDSEAKGLKVLVEDFDDNKSPVLGRKGVDWALENVGHLELAFDTGNFLFAGDEVMETFQHYRSRIVHVHMKDRTASKSKGFSIVAEGIVPFREFFTELRKDGYDGWFVVELYGSRDILGDAETSLKNAEKLLREAGFHR